MRLLLTSTFLLVLSLFVTAQEIPDSLNVIFGPGQRIESSNFTGPVWVERMLVIADESQPVPIGNVIFPPKSRSNWHHHGAGQTLLVLDGVGYYQQEGEAVRVLRKGDKVQCPPNIEHWHGASNDQWFVQLALTKEHPDGRVIWGNPVSDQEYLIGLEVEGKSARYYHLANVASLATRGELAQLKLALRQAIEAGLSTEELREALVHLYAYAGFPRSIQGIKQLMEVSADLDLDELNTREGTAASTQNKYEAGLVTLEQLTGRSWEQPSAYGKFAPRIDTFLKEHLFADVFADESLNYSDREVVTIAVLHALGVGVEPMLNGHRSIARRQGVSETDLNMIAQMHKQ